MEGNKKRGIYIIEDEIFDFWFNFIYKYREEIEREGFVLKHEELTAFLGKKFEKFCLNEVASKLLSEYKKIGRWWYKQQEIDLVAVNEESNSIAFLECKWSNLSISRSEEIIDKLKNKAQSVRWKEEFGIIAKNIEKKQVLRNKNIIALDFNDIIKSIKITK